MKFNVNPLFEETFNWVRNNIFLNSETDLTFLLCVDDVIIQKYANNISNFSEYEKILIASHIIDSSHYYINDDKIEIILKSVISVLKLLSDISYGDTWSDTYEKKKLDAHTPWEKAIFNEEKNVWVKETFEETYNRVSSTKEYQYSLFLLDYITDGNREINVSNLDVPANEIVNLFAISVIYNTISIDKNKASQYMLDLIAERLEVYSYKKWCRRVILADIIED